MIHFQENEESFLLRQDVQLQNFSLHLLGSTWETLQKIFIIKEGSYCYTLRPKLNGISHKIVFEISIERGIKVVTFRTPFRFFNATLLDFELEIENINGTMHTFKISPNNYVSVKIEECYDCTVRLRPLIKSTTVESSVSCNVLQLAQPEDVATLHEIGDTLTCNKNLEGQAAIDSSLLWESSEFISWKQLAKPNETIILASKPSSTQLRELNESNDNKKSKHAFYTALISQIDSGKNTFLDYPLLTVNINYPLIIHNLIPYLVECIITDRETGYSHSFSLTKN